MANLKALPAKDLEIESRLLSTPPLEAIQSALKKVRLKNINPHFITFKSKYLEEIFRIYNNIFN